MITRETVAHDPAWLNCIRNYEIKWRMDFILLSKLENLIFCVRLSLKAQFTPLFLFLLRTHTHIYSIYSCPLQMYKEALYEISGSYIPKWTEVKLVCV